MAAKKQPMFNEPVQRIECAFAGCPYDAKVRVKTKTGWANVCLDHDKKIVKERADAYCKARGLDTVEKQRDWLRKNWKQAPKKLHAEPEISDDEREIAEIPF